MTFQAYLLTVFLSLPVLSEINERIGAKDFIGTESYSLKVHFIT